MVTASDVAKYILSLIDEDAGDTISNMKLQKLLYYVQGFHLAAFDEPLFADEIRAWTYGPVIVDVYHEYKEHGALAIPRPADFEGLDVDGEAKDLIDDVLNTYGEYSASSLMLFTHREPPWKAVYRGGEGSGGVIPCELMNAYFKTQLDD